MEESFLLQEFWSTRIFVKSKIGTFDFVDGVLFNGLGVTPVQLTKMVQITVGQAAGVIAATIFITRLWAPSGLTLILSGLLDDKNTATTWTISSRAFQRSLWTWILQSDSSQTYGTRTGILLVTRLVTWMSILIALAGIITPLGLYDAFVPTNSVQVTFQYLKDKTPFGLGTPLRSTLPFSWVCDDHPCPFSDTVIINIVNSNNAILNQTFPYEPTTHMSRDYRACLASKNIVNLYNYSI